MHTCLWNQSMKSQPQPMFTFQVISNLLLTCGSKLHATGNLPRKTATICSLDELSVCAKMDHLYSQKVGTVSLRCGTN